jgi:hypothetical protein
MPREVLSDEEALKLDRNHGKDTGEKIATVAGPVVSAGAGALAAPAVAAATGATSIPVLTTAGSWVGLSITAATPVGWIVGLAALTGVVGYGIIKLVSSGAQKTGKREAHRQYLEEKMKKEL